MAATGERIGVMVTERHSDTIGAAWSLLGKLAQQQALPLTAAHIGFDTPPADRHLLIVGSKPPAALLKGAPWQAGTPMQFTQPAQGAIPQDSVGWLARQWAWLSGASPATTPQAISTAISADATLAGQLLMMQYRSPLDDDRTATVFIGGNPADVGRGSAELLEARNWDSLAHDVTLLRIGEPGMVSQQVGPYYDVGKIGFIGRIGYAFSQYPLLWLAITLLLVAVLALVTVKLLRRFYLRHHAGVEEETP